MKKIIVTTEREGLEGVLPLIEDSQHFVKDEVDFVTLTIFIPDEGLDDLINKLETEINLRKKKNMIEVYTPDFVISSALKRAEKKVDGVKEKTPVEILIDSTKPHTKLDASKILLTSVAGIIALTGLFMNNIAIVIGAMLLSPLLGPIHAFAINTAIGDPKNAMKSAINLGVLLLMVVIFSFITTLLINPFAELLITPEILSRMDASFIYILMALLLGFASILAISRGISESIAGVAIAAALLPPAVVTGVSLVLYPEKALSSFTLTLENVLGLMSGGLFATIVLDIGPRKYYEKKVARRFIIRATTILFGLLTVLFFVSLYVK